MSSCLVPKRISRTMVRAIWLKQRHGTEVLVFVVPEMTGM